MNGITQILCLMSTGMPIFWKTYGIEKPADDLLVAGFFSAINSFSSVIAKEGALEKLFIGEKIFFIRQNGHLVCMIEAIREEKANAVWKEIKEQHESLLENIPKFEELLQTAEEYRDDFALLVDTIMTKLAGKTKLVRSRSWLGWLRRRNRNSRKKN